MTKCYCYIVECADGTYYTGWAIDPAKRVEVHNKGRGARYTRTRLPVKLVYVEEQPDRKTAMKREMAIKRLGREGKMKLARVGSGQVGKYTSKQVNKYTSKQVNK